MNRAYKVIWNEVKQMWVVVSELAKNRSKKSGRVSRGGVQLTGILAAGILVLGGAFVPQVGMAAETEIRNGKSYVSTFGDWLVAGVLDGSVGEPGYRLAQYTLDLTGESADGRVEIHGSQEGIKNIVTSKYDGVAGSATTEVIRYPDTLGNLPMASITTTADGTTFTRRKRLEPGKEDATTTTTTISGDTISTGTLQVSTLKDTSGNTVALGEVAGMQAELAGKANAADVYTKAYTDTTFATKNELDGKADASAVDANTEKIGKHATRLNALEAADQTLQESIGKKADQTALAAETAAREKADQELQSSLGGKANQTALDTEKADREAADSQLQDQINNHAGTLTQHADAISNIRQELNDIDADTLRAEGQEAKNRAEEAHAAATEAHKAAQDVGGRVTALENKTAKLTRGKDAYGNIETAITETISSSEIEEGKTNAFQSKMGVTGWNTSIETSETITDTATGKKTTHESYGTYGSDIIYQGTQTWDEEKNKGTMSSMQIVRNGTIFDLNRYEGEGGLLVSSSSTRIAGDKITVSDDKGNSSRFSTDGVTAGGQNYERAQAALMADGRIKGAGGKFEVGTDGSIKAADGKFMVDGNGVIEGTNFAVNSSGKVSAKGVDAGGEKVTHVAAGKISADSTDAVNGSQLYSVDSGLRSSISKLDSRINKVGAGAAALAALHPQDFDPADKWNFAMGYGNYRDASAMALGAFYRPDAKTMVSVGGTMGNGENMINVGLSLKLGKSSPYAGMSRQNLIHQLSAQSRDMEDLKAQNASQGKQIEELQKQNAQMQQQIAAILAKLEK